jgi:hypothetical protein
MSDGTQLIVGHDGFLYYDGVKLPLKYLPDRRALQYKDKNRRDANQRRRGTRYVEVPVAEIVRLASATHDGDT